MAVHNPTDIARSIAERPSPLVGTATCTAEPTHDRRTLCRCERQAARREGAFTTDVFTFAKTQKARAISLVVTLHTARKSFIDIGVGHILESVCPTNRRAYKQIFASIAPYSAQEGPNGRAGGI